MKNAVFAAFLLLSLLVSDLCYGGENVFFYAKQDGLYRNNTSGNSESLLIGLDGSKHGVITNIQHNFNNKFLVEIRNSSDRKIFVLDASALSFFEIDSGWGGVFLEKHSKYIYYKGGGVYWTSIQSTLSEVHRKEKSTVVINGSVLDLNILKISEDEAVFAIAGDGQNIDVYRFNAKNNETTPLFSNEWLPIAWRSKTGRILGMNIRSGRLDYISLNGEIDKIPGSVPRGDVLSYVKEADSFFVSSAKFRIIGGLGEVRDVKMFYAENGEASNYLRDVNLTAGPVVFRK